MWLVAKTKTKQNKSTPERIRPRTFQTSITFSSHSAHRTVTNKGAGWSFTGRKLIVVYENVREGNVLGLLRVVPLSVAKNEKNSINTRRKNKNVILLCSCYPVLSCS